jgi:hypothetical protein
MKYITKPEKAEAEVTTKTTDEGVNVIINGCVVLAFKNGDDRVQLIKGVSEARTGLRTDNVGLVFVNVCAE